MPEFPLSSAPLILTPSALMGDAAPGYLMNRLLLTMLDKGFDWDELPADLRSAYALGYYIGKVLNGGNSGFIANAFNFYGIGPLRLLEDAELAARVYNMPQTLAVILQVQDWVAANPDEARQQTGFTGGSAPALDPLDRDLVAADQVEEADWLAILAPLGSEVAARLASGQGYKDAKYPLKFPQRRSLLHEMVFLLQREPRLVVEPDMFGATIAAQTVLPPVALKRVVRNALAELRERLPTPANCAVLDLLNQTGFWLNRPYDARLGPILTRPGKVRGAWEAVLHVVGCKENLLADLSANGMITIHQTEGDPEADTRTAPYPVDPPEKIRDLRSLLRWFGRVERKKRRYEAWIKSIMAKNALRRTSLIAKGLATTGARISSGMNDLHLAEAIALHIVNTGAGSINTWRLLQWRDGNDPMQDWMFGTSEGLIFEAQARPDSVTVLRPAAVESVLFPRADLVAVRAAQN